MLMPHQHHHGHRERLRERFLSEPEAPPDYELLELLLGYVILRKDTKPMAKDLLEAFGSLRGVLDAKSDEIKEIKGIGDGVGNFLALLREIMNRYAESPLRLRESLCSPQEVAAVARRRLGRLGHEEVWAAYVDNRNRLISWERASKGTINASAIYPREIMERALRLKAAGVIIVHNHPSGNSSASGADLEITRRLQHAAGTLNIRLLDHVIVTDSDCRSLLEEGLL